MTNQFPVGKKPPSWQGVGLAIIVILLALFAFPETRSIILNQYQLLAFWEGHAPFKGINVILVGDALSGTEAYTLVRRLTATFPSSIALINTEAVIDNAYDASRKQYDADRLAKIESFFTNQKEDDYIVVVVPGDIYAAGFNFLFAQTSFSPPRTILGTSRLKDGVGGQEFVNRIYKIFLRRIGQMAGLHSKCGPMNFSNSLEELDSASDQYCANDATFLEEKGFIRSKIERDLIVSGQPKSFSDKQTAIKIPISLITPCDGLPHKTDCSIRAASWISSVSVEPEADLSVYRTMGQLNPVGTDWELDVLPDTYRIQFPFQVGGGTLYLKSATWGNVDLTHQSMTVKPEDQHKAIKIVLEQAATLQGNTTENGKPAAAQVVIVGQGPLNVQMSVSGNRNNPRLPYSYNATGLVPGDYFVCARPANAALPASADPLTDSHDLCNKVGKKIALHAGDYAQVNFDLPP